MLSLQHCGGNKPPSNELTRSLQLYLNPDKGFSYAYHTKEGAMPSPQRQSRLYTVREHCTSHINMLREEVNIILDHPTMVPGNDNSYFHDIEDKLAEMHDYMGILTVLDTYFEK